MAVPIGLAAIWFMIVFTICRDKRYRYLTGRTYGADNSKYKRSYHELVEYFQNSEPHKLDTCHSSNTDTNQQEHAPSSVTVIIR